MNNSKLEMYNLGNLNCEFTIDELVGKYRIGRRIKKYY